jgi:hypothetical protein
VTASARAASIALLLMLVASSRLAAQISVEASPLRVEMQGKPGGSTTQAVTLTNVGQETVRVRTTLSDWYLSRDGAPQFEEPAQERPFTASSWVRFAPPEFVLKPGEQGTVRFTVQLPLTVEPGGYRTGLLFDFSPEGRAVSERARQVNVKSRIATLIYVHVGQPPVNVELTALRVRAIPEETEVVATLKNTSRRSVRTKGTLVLLDQSGTVVRQLSVPDVPVLPESEREVAVPTAETTRGLPAGDYRVELRIDVGQSAVLVGETTLTIGR